MPIPRELEGLPLAGGPSVAIGQVEGNSILFPCAVWCGFHVYTCGEPYAASAPDVLANDSGSSAVKRDLLYLSAGSLSDAGMESSASQQQRHHHHHHNHHNHQHQHHRRHSRQPDIRIPERDASIGGATAVSPLAVQPSPPPPLQEKEKEKKQRKQHSSSSSREHRRQRSTAAVPAPAPVPVPDPVPDPAPAVQPVVAAPAETAESGPSSLRVRKGKGRVVEPTSSSPSSSSPSSLPPPPPPTTAAPQLGASAKPRARSPNAKQLHIEPRKSSLNAAAKPAFTRADDQGPLQKLERELHRIGKEEGLIGPEASSSSGISRTLSRKQAQRLLRSTEVPSKQTAIASPIDPPSALPFESSNSNSNGNSTSAAPPSAFKPKHTARSINGQTAGPSSHAEPAHTEAKDVTRHGRFHLHRHHEGAAQQAPHREGIYLDVGQQPTYPRTCAHVCLTDLELVEEEGDIPAVPISSGFHPPLKVKCGPLLRYTGLRKEHGLEIWRGSILIVTQDSESSYEPAPSIRIFGQGGELPAEGDASDDITAIPAVSSTGETQDLRPASDLPEGKDMSHEDRAGDLSLPASLRYNFAPAKNIPKSGSGRFRKDGERQGKAKDFPAEKIHQERGVTFWRFNIEIELGDHEQRIGYRTNNGGAVSFFVPGANETMNIMFHSCNGFSMAVDPNNFCGPDPLWRDVLRKHFKKPFHVMLGGGDQLYNDCVSVQAQKFKDWLAIKDQSVKTTTPFDQEFQDELEHFYLNRYCLWFSQGLFGVASSQIASTNCFDDHDIIDGFGSYPEDFNGCPVFAGLGTVAFKYYMLFQHHSPLSEGEPTEPSWLLGAQPGPFIKEPSRSTFMFLGRRVAFMALDCRTERTRDLLLSNETYGRVFQRLEQEIVAGETKHLIVLLGVPIAYPRLVWLENILTSSLLNPIKYIASKRGDGTMNGFLNKFDGGVELLDDMMDHWTARGHKRERNWLILELQKLAARKDCRVTFLGGDVHLGTFGHFFSRSRLKIPKINDFRYMVNVVSSAIVNTPPPNTLADLLNKRNKIHKLQRDTYEEQIKIFFTDPKGQKRANHTTLPARNYCRISENHTGTHCGEYDSVDKPEGSDGDTNIDFRGGLDLVINFEVDQNDPNGFTKPYGLTTPILQKPAETEA
ncbi:hypothetical protein H072_1350 [Dactylellina haptotyla CBS 200.50]|uniref:PhoD-like phosphatase domain-containing protein n=1 Tax=Dactylellina haptotyla (strain CBS 200.50) TaxID=1284197 RepID=S8BYU3_DACHA|nr:hypothetical protein H072_1350 [Dactylellina haptotyla CBS 200.50]